jgi:hypothetical protein
MNKLEPFSEDLSIIFDFQSRSWYLYKVLFDFYAASLRRVEKPRNNRNSWASYAIIAQLAGKLTLNKMEALSDAYINTLWNEFVQVISRGRGVLSSDINIIVNSKRTTASTQIIVCQCRQLLRSWHVQYSSTSLASYWRASTAIPVDFMWVW